MIEPAEGLYMQQQASLVVSNELSSGRAGGLSLACAHYDKRHRPEAATAATPVMMIGSVE